MGELGLALDDRLYNLIHDCQLCVVCTLCLCAVANLFALFTKAQLHPVTTVSLCFGLSASCYLAVN